MTYDIIGSLLVLIEKLAFFIKQLWGFIISLISVSKSLFFLIYLHKFQFFFLAENFALNANSKNLEDPFNRIYSIILPYFIDHKIHDSSIFYVYVILIYIESFFSKCCRCLWMFSHAYNKQKWRLQHIHNKQEWPVCHMEDGNFEDILMEYPCWHTQVIPTSLLLTSNL